MDLERISREEAEEGLTFFNNGLPKGAKPLSETEFSGYHFIDRNIEGKRVKLIYEPNGKSFIFRNAFYLK